jgi:hypothetical protein
MYLIVMFLFYPVHCFSPKVNRYITSLVQDWPTLPSCAFSVRNFLLIGAKKVVFRITGRTANSRSNWISVWLVGYLNPSAWASCPLP